MTYMKCDYCGEIQPVKPGLKIRTMVLPTELSSSGHYDTDTKDICNACFDKVFNLLESIKKDANRIDTERVAD